MTGACLAIKRSNATWSGRSKVVRTGSAVVTAKRGRSAASACRGNSMRAVGTGSAPNAATSAPSSRFRSSSARSAWRSGRRASGRRGIATNSAACAGSSAAGRSPNQACDPALIPSKLPPNGASVSQMPRIWRLSSRSSNCTARKASITFATNVRRRGSSSRAACIVKVDPPETIRPATAHCATARPSASTSTPPCR